MARASRAKGVEGEKESADLFRAHGGHVIQLQNNVQDAGDYLVEWPSGVVLIVDSKRRERLNLVAHSKQVEKVARRGQIAVVSFRPNYNPWRVSLLQEDFARLLGTT